MTYPGVALFPSTVTFPRSSSFATTGYQQAVQVILGSLPLTATDEFDVDWIANSLQGWFGSSPSSGDSTQKTRAAGAWGSIGNLTAKPITIGGFVDCLTSAALDDAEQRLNAASSLSDTLLTVTWAGQTRSRIVRRQGEVLFTPVNDHVAEFSMQLVALDPRKFATAFSVATGLPSTTGGLTAPLTAPITTGATVSSGIAELTNNGNASGPLVVRFDGPLNAPAVTHEQTGLTFSTSQILATGQYLEIDMEAQTVLEQGQASRNRQITSRRWLPFLPGVNRYALQATSGSGSMTVTGTPSWL